MARERDPYVLDLSDEEEQRRRQRSRHRQSQTRQCANDPAALKKQNIDNMVTVGIISCVLLAVIVGWCAVFVAAWKPGRSADADTRRE